MKTLVATTVGVAIRDAGKNYFASKECTEDLKNTVTGHLFQNAVLKEVEKKPVNPTKKKMNEAVCAAGACSVKIIEEGLKPSVEAATKVGVCLVVRLLLSCNVATLGSGVRSYSTVAGEAFRLDPCVVFRGSFNAAVAYTGSIEEVNLNFSSSVPLIASLAFRAWSLQRRSSRRMKMGARKQRTTRRPRQRSRHRLVSYLVSFFFLLHLCASRRAHALTSYTPPPTTTTSPSIIPVMRRKRRPPKRWRPSWSLGSRQWTPGSSQWWTGSTQPEEQVLTPTRMSRPRLHLPPRLRGAGKSFFSFELPPKIEPQPRPTSETCLFSPNAHSLRLPIASVVSRPNFVPSYSGAPARSRPRRPPPRRGSRSVKPSLRRLQNCVRLPAKPSRIPLRRRSRRGRGGDARGKPMAEM